MKLWKGKIFFYLCVLILLVGSGCLKPQTVDNSDYASCNDTSNGRMAEIESGYFYVHNHIIYYADKDKFDLWVPLCNKPDCQHLSIMQGEVKEEDWCNGYVSTNLIRQKNGKLYEVDRGSRVSIEKIMPSIVEITLDGSGKKKVYEIPWDEKSIPTADLLIMNQERAVLSMRFLDEKGYNHTRLVALEEDENGKVIVNTLYEGENVYAMSSDVRWIMNGEEVLVTDIDLPEGGDLWRNFYRVAGDKLEKLEIPADIHLYYSYLSGNELTYYEQNDGFYKLNLETGEKQLVAESQIEDGCGVAFTDELFIEYNCYASDMFASNGIWGYYPEHTWEGATCIHVYDGTEWQEIEVPEELVNSNRSGYPVSVASDRIFFNFSTGKSYTTDLYYMMLEEKESKLVYAGQLTDNAKKAEEESKEQEEEETTVGAEDDTGFKEITIFDNEDGVLKVTGVRQGVSSYDIDLFFEVGDSGREYDIDIEVLINGIQYGANKSLGTAAYSQKGNIKFKLEKYYLKEHGIADIYSVDEFTDIELTFYVNDRGESSNRKEILKKSVHIYPKGEDAVVHYTREPQEHDIVVVNNEKVKVTVVGYETAKVENDKPIFFVENKSDQDIKFHVIAASINGAQDNAIRALSHESIQAGACAFVKVNLAREGTMLYGIKNFWEDYEVTEIGTIKTLIHIGYCDIGYYSNYIGEPFVEELLTLYPKGEAYAREDARPLQDMEVVLVDNDYVKITHIGYQDYQLGMRDETLIPDAYIKIVVENKTDKILYGKIPTRSKNGLMSNHSSEEYVLLPGECYTQVVGFFDEETSYKSEFLYQILDKERNLLNQEYVTIYPFGEEMSPNYEVDLESMEEILVDNESFTIAIQQYRDSVDDYNKELVYYNSSVDFCIINKINKMICYEISDMVVNGIQQESDLYNEQKQIVFAQGVSCPSRDLTYYIQKSNMTELEDVEMTFKVYEYHYEDGTLGVELGSTTVKFGPKN